MEEDSKISLSSLRVDGGASFNNFLLQFQADILDADIVKPKVIETTALGAAYLAGLAVGYYENTEEIKKNWQMDKTFHANISVEKRQKLIDGWEDSVSRILAKPN